MTPEEKQRAARQYAQDPLFALLLSDLRMDAYREWSGTAPEDKETREVAYHKHSALTQLQIEVENLAR